MQQRPKVLITRMIPDEGLNMIQEHCRPEVGLNPSPIPSTTLLERVQGVDGLLCLLSDTVDAQMMDAAGPQLKVISQYAVGFDNIDIAEAARRNIPVGHTPGVLTDATADFTWALMMAAARRLVEGVDYVRAGKWRTWGPTILQGYDIHGATLGIVGLGRIGKAVARRASGFNMRVLAYSPRTAPEAAAEVGAELVDLETLLQESDFISLHVPLTDETYHMIDADALALMKPTATLVNTSRGAVIDQKALTKALETRVIAFAALDVTNPEPIEMDDPLLDLDNVIVAPHIASASVAARNQMAVIAAENLLAGLRGEALPHRVPLPD